MAALLVICLWYQAALHHIHAFHQKGPLRMVTVRACACGANMESSGTKKVSKSETTQGLPNIEKPIYTCQYGTGSSGIPAQGAVGASECMEREELAKCRDSSLERN